MILFQLFEFDFLARLTNVYISAMTSFMLRWPKTMQKFQHTYILRVGQYKLTKVRPSIGLSCFPHSFYPYKLIGVLLNWNVSIRIRGPLLQKLSACILMLHVYLNCKLMWNMFMCGINWKIQSFAYWSLLKFAWWIRWIYVWRSFM